MTFTFNQGEISEIFDKTTLKRELGFGLISSNRLTLYTPVFGMSEALK